MDSLPLFLFPRIANVSRHILSRLSIYFFVYKCLYILYGLYFDDVEHAGDFDVFSGHSQYLAFSLDGGKLDGLDGKGHLFCSIDVFSIY